MAAQETGKQRAARMPLDYYKRPTRLERWKERLGALALLVTVAWLVGGLLRKDQGELRYSRGPVAHVHQTWEANCTACHEPFVPIQSDHWATTYVSAGREEGHRCQSCHAGPPHHAGEKSPPSCASCHREHRGRDVSLVRSPDHDCTQCHADLVKHMTGSDLRFANVVSRFSKEGHPEFQHLKKTAAKQKLKFNHKLHMSAGMATPEKGDPKFTLDRLPLPFRKSYEDQQEAKGDTARIQLQCSSCHQLDHADLKLAGPDMARGIPQRGAGAYMLPIRYEAHCQACHPLTFDRTQEGDRASSYLAVRHGLQPPEIRQYLEGLYTAKALNDELKIFTQFVPVRPLPGKLPSEDRTKVRTLINNKVAAAEKSLYLGKKTCGECHHYEPQDMVDEKNPGAAPAGRIAATQVPQVWFSHALFNHAAHRGVDCRSCHENAYADTEQKKPNLTASQASEDILIPGLGNCLECHAPQTGRGGLIRGGARYDCTECHRYHHGDYPLHGIGAAARAPAARRAIDDFLSGTRTPK
jgi:hypothetical protein